jgi:hypothetical protein
MGQGPVETIRIGNVSITIWENVGKDFTTQSFQIAKNYLDKNKDWQSTNSFKLTELDKLRLAIDEALKWKYLSKDDKPEQTNNGGQRL